MKMKKETESGCWRRKDMRKFNRYLPAVTLVVVVSVIVLPSYTYAFGSSNRRPPPPNQPGNNRPGPPPPPSIRRQGLPFEGGPPQNGNSNNAPPIGHRRIQGPPPHHTKPRGRPPFPFPRRRPPPPPRGRPPPPRDRERERDRDHENRGRPPHKNVQDPKLSFHIPPPPPPSTPASHVQQQHQQDSFQQRPPQHNHNQHQSESQNFQQFQQNQHQNMNQFQQNQNQQQFQNQQFHNQQQQHGQFPQHQNNQFPQQNNQFPNLPPTQFPNQQFPQNQQHQQKHQHPQNSFQQGPMNQNFQAGPSQIPPTFIPNPSANPPPFHNQLQGLSQFPQITNPPHPQMNPSQIPPFANNPSLPPFQQHHHQSQQPLFGQMNPAASGVPQPFHHHNNNPNNPPILEYAPPPNTFQSTPNPDMNLLQDKSKEIELNSIPKQTITFTVTPKPSKTGGTQLHFKISTPKPFKTALKPITNSKGYFKGSTYRPPVDKLNSKFKYSNSNPGYPDTEYRVQDGSRRDSSMSAEMEPPSQTPSSIKDLLLNRDHALNHPTGPHPDDTDHYTGSSYDSPPVFAKPMSGEEVLIAGVNPGKSNYHKGRPDDDFGVPPSGQPFDEDYDNGPPTNGHRNSPFDEDDGSKSYSDRHLHSYSPTKENHFDEYSNGKNEEQFRRPSHSGSREENYDEFERPSRPLLHIDEESLPGSGESGKTRHGSKFSQPDPLYHPEGDNGSGSRERDRENEEFADSPSRYEGHAFSGSGERRTKYKDSQSKSTAEELLAALGLSTNPLVSMPNSKYPVDIPTKYSLPGSSSSGGGSWENAESENQKRKNGNPGPTAGGNGEPMGLLEYLNQKKDETGQPSSHSTEPLYSVPDRQIGGSAENSFVVKGSMKTASGGGVIQDSGKASSNNVILGRPIPQFQGTEPDIITKQNPVAQHSSYIEQKIKGHNSYTSSPGQESYLYDKIHGGSPKDVHHSNGVPVINTGLYGPSVPPPISEPGTFTDSPPLILASPSPAVVPVAIPSPVVPVVAQQPTILHHHHQQTPTGSESYLYQKIHGDKPSNLGSGLTFGPTPPSPHSVEDLSNTGIYNAHHHHHQTGLYALPSEQQPAATGQPTGLVYANGKLVSPQQQQTIGNGVLLPAGMGGIQQQLGPNSIQVNAPQQKLVTQQTIQQPQHQIYQQQGIPQQSQTLIAQQSQQQQQQHPHPSNIFISQMAQQQMQLANAQQPTILHPQQQQTFTSGIQQQMHGSIYQAASSVLAQQQQQQQPLGQHSQTIPQFAPPPSAQQPQQQQHGSLYGDSIDRSAPLPHQSAEVGHQHPFQQGSPFGHPQSQHSPHHFPQYQQHQFAQHQMDPSISASNHQQYQHAGSAVTPRYGEPYPIYVTEPDPIIEIIVQDSNMTLPAMPTLPPPPPPGPPTPEPVHVFYVKYSQKNNTPVFDNYYGQSNPQIQLEQPISSVPVRGPDRNGMLPVDDGPDQLSQSSIQHQSIYNNVYGTSTEDPVSTTPGGTTTLRTIIRPDRNEFSHASSGLVVSFDNPAVEHEIFANYTNQHQQVMQQQNDQQQQQQHHQQPQEQHHQHQHEQQGQYPEITFPPQQQQQQYYYPPQNYQPSQPDPYAHHQQQPQQQAYPSLDSLWGGLQTEQKNLEQQNQLQQVPQNQGFQKRIGLQELASLLETGPNDGQQEEQKSGHIQQQQQDYHQQQQHQENYGQNGEQNPPPLYQYEPQHQSPVNTRGTKLPEDVPEELRNQLMQSGILGNADIQVINYSENLFKELGELPPEALAAFQAHTGNTGSNKQLTPDQSQDSQSHSDQSIWSGSQVSIANTDLASLLPSGRSLRSVLVVKNSLRPKRGGRQRRVVLLITNKDDVLMYKPKDRSLKRIGLTTNPLIRRAIELSNHRMDDEDLALTENQRQSA